MDRFGELHDAGVSIWLDEHGTTRTALDDVGCDDILDKLARADIELASITPDLEREGVNAFNDSYRKLLACIAQRAGELESAAAGPSKE